MTGCTVTGEQRGDRLLGLLGKPRRDILPGENLSQPFQGRLIGRVLANATLEDLASKGQVVPFEITIEQGACLFRTPAQAADGRCGPHRSSQLSGFQIGHLKPPNRFLVVPR